MTTVSLPLTADGRFFIQRLSSDDYESLVFETFLPADLAYTFFFRYPRLFEHDIPNNDNTNGFAIDFTSSNNPFYAIIITLIIGGISAANLYREYSKQKKAQLNTSYRYIHGELEKQGHFEDEQAYAELEEEIKKRERIRKSWLESHINKIYAEDKELQKKYKSIKLDAQNNLQFELKPKDPVDAAAEKPNKPGWFRRNIINKVVRPLWAALGISSFAYWILWIGSALVTNTFGEGVAGVSPWIGFGIPFALGSVYTLIKSYRWYKNNYANRQKPVVEGEEAAPTAEEQAGVENDACQILRKAILARRFELLKQELQSELGSDYRTPVETYAEVRSETLDNEISYLGRDAKTKAATTFVSSAMSSYVGVQYGAWIVTDVLSKLANVTSAIPIVNVICGSLFLAGSVAYGIYNAVKKYGSVKTAQKSLQTQVTEAQQANETLEQKYKAKLENIKLLKQKVKAAGGKTHLPKMDQFDKPQFFSDVTRTNESLWTRFKKGAVRALTFFNGITAGAFVARVFLVKGTAVFLPFAAAAFSNPVTAGLVCGLGVAYGLFKLYEYHKNRKEKRAQDALKQSSERMACLKEQFQAADLCEQVLSKRLNKALNPHTVEASKPEPELASTKKRGHKHKHKHKHKTADTLFSAPQPVVKQSHSAYPRITNDRYVSSRAAAI